MKNIYLLLLLISGAVMAQIPEGFSYQAVALNSSGNAVASSPVKVRISILDNSATGTAVYTETHNPTTNNLGLFTLTIGQGTPVIGTFAGINWGQNSKFLKVEIDVNNGANYITVGASQLLAVPYAMYAGAVAGMGGTSGTALTSLYLYGSFNSFNAGTALQMNIEGNNRFLGYKYLTAGTQLKFITALNSPVPYGNSGNNVLGPNGAAFTVNSSGIYEIYCTTWGEEVYEVTINSIPVTLNLVFSSAVDMTYNAGTGQLSAIVNVPASIPAQSRVFTFHIGQLEYGDNLLNGSIERGGSYIPLPGIGNYKITLNLNFTGDGSPYTITAL